MKQLIPRLLLITVIILAVGAARNRIAQLVFIGVVKSKTGLELSVRSTSFEPLQGALRLECIQIPNPSQAGKEFATVDSLDAVLNTDDLLKKLYRLETVEIRGIHYRADSGDEKLFVPQEIWDRFKTRFPDWFAPNLDHDWSTLLSGKLDPQTLSLLKEQFASAKIADGMSEKWKEELQPLFQKTQTISQRLQRIRSAVQDSNQKSKVNPLESLAAVLQDAGSLETDLQTLVSEANTLQKSAKNEATALKQSLQDDIAKIKDLKPPKIDQRFVSEILIGPELNERFATILAWIESVNEMMNEPEEKETSWFGFKRARGTDVVFESRKNITEYCVKRVEFDGDLTFEDKPVYFVGRMYDIASPAANWEQATTIQICLDSAPFEIGTPQQRDAIFADSPLGASPKDSLALCGPIFEAPFGSNPVADNSASAVNDLTVPRMYITAILDQRSEIPKQRYMIACPSMELPTRILGKEESLAFAVSPGLSRFYAVVDRNGEQLDGRVRFTQSSIRLTPTLPPNVRGSEFEAMLTAIADGIDGLDAELTVSGTIENPQFQIQSDLGDRFAANLQPIMLGKWNESRQLLAKELNDQTNDALRQVGGLFNEQLDPLLNQLTLARSQLTGDNPNTSVKQTVQSLMSGDTKEINKQLQQQGTQLLNNALQNALQKKK